MQIKFRIPEIVLGALLAAAIFAMGMTFESSLPSLNQEAAQARDSSAKHSAAKIIGPNSPDERIANYTWWLAVLTGGLVVVAACQGFFLIRADRTARISANAATSAVEAASADFIASHPPKLRVRNIVINPPQTTDGRRLSMFAKGQVIRGQLFIVNVGGSRADILDGHCMVFWSKNGLPMRRPYEGQEDNLQAMSRTLLSGQSTPVVFQSGAMVGDEGPTFGQKVIAGHDLYVMGWVTYADRNNDVRRTTFCREYFALIGPDEKIAGPQGRFYVVNNPDYEYEE
jgi:hypothetical protein